MDTNPYQPPAHEGLTADTRSATVRRIKGPSTGLILLLAIQIVGNIVAGLIATATLAIGSPVGASPIELCLAAAHFLTMMFMLRSLLQIRRLQQLRNGRIAAGLACVPFLSPWIWIGIPFGVWLSIVLAKPETAEAFGTGPHGVG